MLSELINKPCTLVLRLPGTTADDFGNEKPVIEEVETVCEVQLQQAVEPSGEGEVSVGTWTVFLLTGFEARTQDALVVPGYGEYEFVGDTWDARQGSPRMWHVEGHAKRTDLPNRGVS